MISLPNKNFMYLSILVKQIKCWNKKKHGSPILMVCIDRTTDQKMSLFSLATHFLLEVSLSYKYKLVTLGFLII